jgi:hypothetical protein
MLLTIHHAPPSKLSKPSVASKPPLAYRRDRRTDTTRFDHPHSTTDIGRNMVTPIHTCHVSNRSAGLIKFLAFLSSGRVTTAKDSSYKFSASTCGDRRIGAPFSRPVSPGAPSMRMLKIPALFSRSGAAPYAHALSRATPNLQPCGTIIRFFDQWHITASMNPLSLFHVRYTIGHCNSRSKSKLFSVTQQRRNDSLALLASI